MQYPTVNTRLIILLGTPLGHSVSPQMHNLAFQKLDLDYCYLPVEVTTADLETVFNGLTRMNIAGCNVTIPHKISIIKYLDELDPLAATIGAVNTVCIKNGKTIGYNTDGEGFLQSLEASAHITPKGRNFFLLGAGGAGRAISMTLAHHGAGNIYICNRTFAKAKELATEINKKIRTCAVAIDQTATDRAAILQNCDVLINSTSIGMHPNENELPIEESLISKHLIVADIVYNPLTTQLLKIAKEKGCPIVRGLGMLVNQGAAGFRLWTGAEPPIEEMSDAVFAAMKNRH
jgi:shikimate dehydrogenase